MEFLNKKTIKTDKLPTLLDKFVVGFDKEMNKKERMKFVEFWANYVRTHPDKEWSRQQKIVVDSQLRNLSKRS